MVFIKKIFNLNNYIFISILLICIFLAANEFIKLKKINKINYQINNNELVINDQYEKISLCMYCLNGIFQIYKIDYFLLII